MIPRRPQPRVANPEPMIPGPNRAGAGCRWCGGPTGSPNISGCPQCTGRERDHRQRMNALAEREAELRNQLLEQQLTNDNERPTT